jgi:hypothetical protein
MSKYVKKETPLLLLKNGYPRFNKISANKDL